MTGLVWRRRHIEAGLLVAELDGSSPEDPSAAAASALPREDTPASLVGDGLRTLGGEYTSSAHGDRTQGACTSGLGPSPETRPQSGSIDVVLGPTAPTWFGPADRPLFGCWYVPDAAMAHAGVVLVGARGSGAEASARAMHAVALRLREAGYLVLRYDPPGVGDSADGAEDGIFRKSGADTDALSHAVTAVRASGAGRIGVVGMYDAAVTVARAGEPVDAQVLWDPSDLHAIRPGRGRVLADQTLVLLRETVTAGNRVSSAFDPAHTQWGVARGQATLLDESADHVVLPEPTIGVVAWWLDRELRGDRVSVHPPVRSRRITTSPGSAPVVDDLITVGDLPAVRSCMIGPATGPTVVLAGSELWGRAGPHRAWNDLARRLATAGRPVVRLDLAEESAALYSGSVTLLDLARDLDVDDLVVVGPRSVLPIAREDYRPFALLTAPRRVAFEPVPAGPGLWDDQNLRTAEVAALEAALLGYVSPVVDLAFLDEPEAEEDPAFTEARETLVVAPPPLGRSRLPFVTGLVGLGLVVQAAGYALGRSGKATPAELLFFLGLLTIFTPCAWRLIGSVATRRERLLTSSLLGVALVLSLHLLSPGIFTGYDEMLHEGTVWRLGTQHTLFVSNPLLPVSPRYPGLELFTLAVHWCTGLPVIAAQFAVLFVARLVLVLIIFLFTERLTGSTRAGSVSVVVYAVSPQFYSFNAAYAYQTLALALGGGALYLVLRAADAQRRQRARALAIAMLCTAGVVITHHLVGWITVGALAVWWVAMLVTKRREHVRTVGIAAAFGFVFASVWTAVNASALYDYLEPIVSSALSGILGLLGQKTSSKRTLFKADNGIPTPSWQKLLLLGSTVIVLALLALGIRAVFRNRARTGRPLLRGGVLRFLVVVVAASYLVVLGSRLSGPAAQFGGRASTFVFFGIAPVVAAWFVARTPPVRTSVATVVAAVTFLGGVLFGAASWTYLPGPYLPAADERSIDSSAMAAAHWAAAHLPIGSAIADDHDNGALMGDIGHVDPVTEGVPGGVNVGPLYFDKTWGSYDTQIVRKAGIRYLVVDKRLAQGPPAFGVYFEAGETQGPERLTLAQLTKFAAVPGVRAIYTNGPITIYDLKGILGSVPAHVSQDDARSTRTAIADLENTDWLLLSAALLVAGLWLVRVRHRVRSADRVLDGLLVGTAASFLFAVVIICTPLPASVAAYLFLAAAGAGALGLWDRLPLRRVLVGPISRLRWAHAIRLGLSSRRRTTGALV